MSCEFKSRLKVTGNVYALSGFKRKAKSEEDDLEVDNFLTPPRKFLSGACESNVQEEDNGLVYRFSSYNGSIKPAIVTMSRMFTALDFELRFEVEGCEETGLLVVKKGNITKEKTGSKWDWNFK